MDNDLSMYPIGQLGNGLSIGPSTPGPLLETSLMRLQQESLEDHSSLKKAADNVYDYFQWLWKRPNITRLNIVSTSPVVLQNVNITLQFTVVMQQQVGEVASNSSSTPGTPAQIYPFQNQLPNQAPKPPSQRPKTSLDALTLLLVGSVYNWSLLEWFDLLLRGDYVIVSRSVLGGMERLSASNLQKIRELKEALTNYSADLDKILLSCTSVGLGIMESNFFTAMKQNKDEVQKLIRIMKVDDLDRLLPRVANIFPESILCAILGMELSFCNDLRNRPAKFRNHQPDIYWTKKFLADNCGKCDLAEAAATDLKAEFVQMGFTESRASQMSDWVQSSPFQDHQTPEYWAERFVDICFKYDILLNDAVMFPFGGIANQWNEYQVERAGDDSDESDIIQSVRYINVENAAADAVWMTRDGAKYPTSSNDEYLVLHHGTDHESAQSILQKGIVLSKGREKQDFSDRNGFYLNKDFGQAKEWAEQIGNRKFAAVVVFKIPKMEMNENNFNGLDLYEARSKQAWMDIVRYNRLGRPNDLKKRMRKSDYNAADYVEGPMCANIRQETGNDFVPSGHSRDGMNQFCVLSEKMAEFLGALQYIDSVIFFGK